MATPTFKAASVANASVADGTTVTIASYACPVLTDGYMFVAIGFYKDAARTISSVVFNTTTNLAQIAAFQITNSTGGALWGIKAPPNATGNIVITLSGTAWAVASVSLYEGVDQTTPVGTGATNSHTTGTTFTIDVSSVSGDLVVAMVGSSIGAVQSTTWTSATERADFSEAATADVSTADLAAVGTTTTMAGSATTSGERVDVGVALKGSGAAAAFVRNQPSVTLQAVKRAANW